MGPILGIGKARKGTEMGIVRSGWTFDDVDLKKGKATDRGGLSDRIMMRSLAALRRAVIDLQCVAFTQLLLHIGHELHGGLLIDLQ